MHPADLQLLDGAPALQTRGLDLALALDLGRLGLRLRAGLGHAHPGLGVRPLLAGLGQRDLAGLIGRLHLAAALDVVDLAGAGRRDARLLGRLFGGDARLLDGALALRLALGGRLLAGDALGVDAAFLGDARGLCGLARGDLGLLHRAALLDPRLLGGAALVDARRLDGAFLRDARHVGRLARFDLLRLHRAGPGDLTGAGHALGLDARLRDGALLGDARALRLLARGDLGGVQHPLALDLGLAHLALGGDPRRLHAAFALDAGALPLGLSFGALAGQLGALLGAAELDLALLLDAGNLAVALDVERQALGLQVARPDADGRVLLDIVAQPPPLLDVADELGQALGVEAVGGVEELQRGLVDIAHRHALQLQPVGREVALGHLRDARHVGRPALVHLGHAHLGRRRAERALELACQHVVQAFRPQRAPPERGRRAPDRLARRGHADVELRIHVHAHPVAGDERLLPAPFHRDRQRGHGHRRDVVDHRQHERAPVDHHLLAHEPGAHEGRLLRRAPVEPAQERIGDRDRHDRHDQPQDDLSDDLSGHCRPSTLPVIALSPRWP